MVLSRKVRIYVFVVGVSKWPLLQHESLISLTLTILEFGQSLTFFFFLCTLIIVASSLLLLISILYKFSTIRGTVIKSDEFLNSEDFCKKGKNLMT